MHFNLRDLTLLSVLLTLPAAGGRMRPETARIQELHVRPVGLQPAAGSDTVLVDANREDRTLVSAVQTVAEILAVPPPRWHRERL